MLSDRTFMATFFISLCTHGIILFQRLDFNLFTDKPKMENLKISYVKAPEKEKPTEQNKRNVKQEPFFKLPSKVTVKPVHLEIAASGKTEAFNDIKRIISLDSALIKPNLIKPDITGVKKKITLSPPKSEINKISDPSYISYSQISREKIRRALYQNYGDSTATGIINLAFIVSKDGGLKDAHITEPSSSAPFLREIALTSVREAAPFPDFPDDLNYHIELPFNVEISFEPFEPENLD